MNPGLFRFYHLLDFIDPSGFENLMGLYLQKNTKTFKLSLALKNKIRQLLKKNNQWLFSRPIALQEHL